MDRSETREHVGEEKRSGFEKQVESVVICVGAGKRESEMN